MKTKQLIISFLGLCTVVACSSDRDQEISTQQFNPKTSSSVRSVRVISDTLKLNTKSPLNDTKQLQRAESDQGDTKAPIESETIDPTKSDRPK